MNLKLLFVHYSMFGGIFIIFLTILARIIEYLEFTHANFDYYEIIILLSIGLLMSVTLILLHTKLFNFIFIFMILLPLIALIIYFPIYKNPPKTLPKPTEFIAIGLVFISIIIPFRYFIMSYILYSMFLVEYLSNLGNYDSLQIFARLLFILWLSIFLFIGVYLREKTFDRIEIKTAELMETNKSLDKRVNERTDLLQKANQELKEFSYVVSHDLKNPLKAMGLKIDVIYQNKTNLSEYELEQLHDIKNRINSMTSLIDGVLMYSEIGNKKEEYEEIDLNILLNEIKDLSSPLKEISVQILNDFPLIYFNKTRIRQLFNNLINNAIIYNDKKVGWIKIGCRELPNKYYEFSIQDNGQGIEEARLNSIFLAFNSGKKEKNNGGTGIGLSIVKKIVELLKGEIKVRSVLGEGTTFTFTISSDFIIKH